MTDGPAGDPEPQTGIQVGVLGLNAWLLTVALPALLGGTRIPAWPVLLMIGAPVPVLLAGVRLLPTRARLATWLLLAGFPSALGLGVLALERGVEEPPSPGMGWLLAILATAAYLMAVAQGTASPRSFHPSTVRPLGKTEVPGQPQRPRWTRGILLTLTIIGATLLALFPTLFPDSSQMGDRWGDGAEEATLLVAMAGLALGVAVLTLFLGPGLRAARGARPRPIELRRRLATHLVLAALSLLAFFALSGGGS